MMSLFMGNVSIVFDEDFADRQIVEGFFSLFGQHAYCIFINDLHPMNDYLKTLADRGEQPIQLMNPFDGDIVFAMTANQVFIDKLIRERSSSGKSHVEIVWVRPGNGLSKKNASGSKMAGKSINRF